MVDAGDCLVDVAPALAAEAEGSCLGGFEGVAWPVGLDLIRNRLDLCKNGRCGVDSDCA